MTRPLVLATQRVDGVPGRTERRDALDQQWAAFFDAAGYAMLPLPNRPEVAVELFAALRPAGLLLSGGNDLAAYGGDAPERDATELAVLEHALANGIPVLAVCRGVQLIQARAGVPLERVEGHITPSLTIERDGESVVVNSYHKWGTRQDGPFEVFARAPDGVVKGIRAPGLTGIMWHPERETPFRSADLEFVRRWFPA